MQIDLLSMVGALVPGIRAKQNQAVPNEFAEKLDSEQVEPDSSPRPDCTETRSVDEKTKEAPSESLNANDTKTLDPSEIPPIDLNLNVAIAPWIAPPLLSWSPLGSAFDAPSMPIPSFGIEAIAPSAGSEPMTMQFAGPPSAGEVLAPTHPKLSEAQVASNPGIPEPILGLDMSAVSSPDSSALEPPKAAGTLSVAPESTRVSQGTMLASSAVIESLQPTYLQSSTQDSAGDESLVSSTPGVVTVLPNSNKTAVPVIKPPVAVDHALREVVGTPVVEPAKVPAVNGNIGVKETELTSATRQAVAVTPIQSIDDAPIDDSQDETGSMDAESPGSLPSEGLQTAPAVKNSVRLDSPVNGNPKSEPMLEERATMSEVVDRIESLVAKRGSGSVTIHLEPRELGQLIITVKQLNGKVEAEVQATEPKVREQLAANQSQLHQQIERKGLQVESLRFTEPSMHQHSSDSAGRNQEQLSQQDFQRAHHLRSTTTEVVISPTSEPWWNRNSDGFDMTA